MRHTRVMSAIAVGVAVTISLAGCSEAKDAADKAKDKAGEAADSAKAEASKKADEKAAEAKAKAKDKGKEALDKAKKKAGLDGDDKATDGDEAAGADEAGASDVKVDLGDFADDPSAQAVTAFFEARQAAAASSGEDVSDLKAATTKRYFKKSKRYVKKHSGETKPFNVVVAGSESGSVDVCVGPKGAKARTLVVKGDKVARNAKGDHTCA